MSFNEQYNNTVFIIPFYIEKYDSQLYYNSPSALSK